MASGRNTYSDDQRRDIAASVAEVLQKTGNARAAANPAGGGRMFVNA